MTRGVKYIATAEQLEYVKSDEILRQLAGLSMEERLVSFKKRFKKRQNTVSVLRRLYRE